MFYISFVNISQKVRAAARNSKNTLSAINHVDD